MTEAVFIIADSRRRGAEWAKSQELLGAYKIVITEEEAVHDLRGTTPAMVVVLNGDYAWDYDRILRRLNARAIKL